MVNFRQWDRNQRRVPGESKILKERRGEADMVSGQGKVTVPEDIWAYVISHGFCKWGITTILM